MDDLQARLDRAITDVRQAFIDVSMEHAQQGCRHLEEACFATGFDRYAALVALRARRQTVTHLITIAEANGRPHKWETLELMEIDAKAEWLLGKEDA